MQYNNQRISDPFMTWFREQEQKGTFTTIIEKTLIVLIDARFDQLTTAENALENTKRVYNAGALYKIFEGKKVLIVTIQR